MSKVTCKDFNLKNFLKRNIFLIDGIGALSSCLSLGILVPLLNIGIPHIILSLLSIVALVFAIYSLSCFLFKISSKRSLRIIADANLVYASLTTLVVGLYYKKLSILGLTYFLIEINLIIILVYFEYKISKEL